MHDELGIGTGLEVGALGLELGAETVVLVELAVDDGVDLVVVVVQGLLAACGVDDGQSDVAETCGRRC
jgi:hypothetical protein